MNQTDIIRHSATSAILFTIDGTCFEIDSIYDKIPLHQKNIFITIHLVMCYK